MDRSVGTSSRLSLITVAMLLSTVLVKKTGAQWGGCPGGCCDCFPVEPPPCSDPLCIPEPIPLPPPDTVPPIIHGCPRNVPSRSISRGRDTVSICWTEPWASDNRGPAYIQPVRQGKAPCSEFPEGTHIISYTATDFAGNKAACQFTITIHAIVCTMLRAPPYGRVQCNNGIRQGSVCSYYCNANYYIISGSKQRECGAHGQWSGTEANCQMRRCDILMPPTNGVLRCHGGDVPGSTCTYVCNVGYYIESGTETRRCRADGYWAGSEVRCAARRCAQLNAPPNGYLSCSGMTPGETCHYRCDVGYYITVGSTTRTCRTNGEWSGSNAICQRKMEPCPTLPSPLNGRISCYGDNNPGSWCQYHCNSGYTLQGVSSRVCGNEGRWTGSEALCQRRSCSTLSPPLNGVISCSAGDTIGSRCQYSCNTGYRLMQGSEQRTCQQSGQWSGVEAICGATTCPVLSSPRNGYVRCDGNSQGSQCHYECDSGYNIAGGSRSRTCQGNGQWSGSEATCTVVTCQDLTNPRNGYVRCQGQDSRRRCTYYCDSGYVLSSGSQYRDCSNGAWSGTEPACTRETSCRTLRDPANGFVRCQGNNEVGSRCTYYCNESERCRLSSGSTDRECGRDGQWSGTEAVCECEQNRPCPFLSEPPNARIMCSTTDNREGTYCDYMCNAGYQHISGPRRTVCQRNSRWSTQETVVCRAQTCRPLRAISNGEIVCSTQDEYRVSSRCDYRCHSGYTLIPDSRTTVRVCGTDGTWSGVPGRCDKSNPVISSCQRLNAPVNGDIDCDTDDYRVGTMCVHTCDSGYRLSRGSSDRVCRRNSRWSGRDAICEKEARSCSPLSEPRYGSIRCDGYNDGDRCEYTCDRGYSLTSGSRVRTCNGERWSGAEAVCSGKVCEPLTSPPNGEVVCSGDHGYGAKCDYYCNIGYYVSGGAYTRYCDMDGTWTGRTPTCSAIQVTCTSKYYCRRQCNYRSCSGSYTRLRRAIDTVKYKPRPQTML